MTPLNPPYHPTFSYESNPLLNVSPLIDLYPNCLTHVVDTDGLFQLSTHKIPIILSHKRAYFKPTLTYQTSFARVKSPRCLLTIASLLSLWNYNTESLIEFITQTVSTEEPIPNFAVLFPQSVIILTYQNAQILGESVNYGRPCYHGLPFILQLNEDVKSFPVISGVLAYHGGFKEPLSFNCSTFESCTNEMERTTTAFAKIFQASWNNIGYISDSNGDHPFRRGAARAGLTGAVASFIREPHNLQDLQCGPYFQRSHSNIPNSLTEIFEVSRTASVKFVTTAGVFTPQSTYHVYFSTFSSTTWLSILMSAGTCLVVMVGSFGMQRQPVKAGVLSLFPVVTYWVFATGIGQYHHSNIPLISSGLSRKVVWVVAPMVVTWFILSTLLLNVYCAIFSSDATRSFYYLTNYTDYFQLPIDTKTYILVNESHVRRNPFVDRAGDKCASPLRYLSDESAAYQIGPSIFNKIRELGVATSNITSSGTKHGWKITQQQQRLNKERLKLWTYTYDLVYTYECANIETLSRLLRSEEPLVFLMPAHDFQKYWQLFVQLMRSDQTIKVANNFYSDDGIDLSEPVAYEFTSRLHTVLKGSVVTRMKILLSSGIYSLWDKWHRIKFTDGGLQHAEKKLPSVNKVDPVSFDNSGTPWVFLAQAIAWLVAAGILLVERTAEYFRIAPVGMITD